MAGSWFPDPLEMPGEPSRRKLVGRLYHGETRFDFVGRTKIWFALSGVIILAGLASLVANGLNLGIDFEGGAVWELPARDSSVESVREALAADGLPEAKVQTLESDTGVRLRIQNESLGLEREQQVATDLASLVGVDEADVTLNSVGPSWGEEISRKALNALVVFLIAITIYVTFRFEFKMALATLAALFHDIFVTVGIYSIGQFPVTPATVIAFLTILGYSIYDGIVVFDRVDENTRLVSSTNRVTYSGMINLSLNQTLMRSLNTQLTAMLPMLSLLIVGSLIMGATTLEEFALALLIGQVSGAYSSIFIASPALAMLKEREPRFKEVRRRIEARLASSASSSPIDAPPVDDDIVGVAASEASRSPAPATATTVVTAAEPRAAAPSGPIPPRPRKKTRKR
jgi:preprotein translocase subunit SecF